MEVDSIDSSYPEPKAHVPPPPPPPHAQRSSWQKGQWYQRDTGSWGWYSEGRNYDREEDEK
eukprot:10568341-Karenia_brevis.AAC.1